MKDNTNNSMIVHIETPQADTEISGRDENPLVSPIDIDCTSEDQKLMSSAQVSMTDVDESISITIDNDESC